MTGKWKTDDGKEVTRYESVTDDDVEYSLIACPFSVLPVRPGFTEKDVKIYKVRRIMITRPSEKQERK